MATGIETIITEQDRREAAIVSTSQAGHKFEIQLGHLCNNRCVFCSSGQLTAMKIAKAIPLEPIVAAIEEARANGATHLTFLGGEPTIHKRFLEALERTVELGFEHIVIFTNGVMFPHPGFIESVCALGNFEWRISIQGATDEAHVAATGRADAFQRIIHGLGELQKRNQLVTTNMCVNERSYRSLPAYPELLEHYGVKQLHVDIVRPASTGERDEAYLRDIMPRYSDMAPYYADMLKGFDEWDPDFDVNVGNMPYCILPAWGHRVHHGGEETVTKSSDGEGLEDAMNKYEWHSSLRTHLPGCSDCAFRSRCTGIFSEYLEMYGGDEFQPVSREDLRRIDPERRNFVLQAEPDLASLRAALAAGEVPAPWQFRNENSEDRRRAVELLFTADKATLTVTFLPPGQADAAIARTEAYDLAATAGVKAKAADIETLLGWIAERLSESSNAITLSETAAEETMCDALLERGRKRVVGISRKLLRGLNIPGWRVASLDWTDANTGRLRTAGPSGKHIDLVFALGTQDGRSQVDLDFQPSDDTDEHSAKAVIDCFVTLIGGGEPPAAPQQ